MAPGFFIALKTNFYRKDGKFSLNRDYIKKIPLNPPLQKGEAFGMPRFIEMLPKTQRNNV